MGLLTKIIERINEERCRVCGMRFGVAKGDYVCRGSHTIGYGHVFSDGYHAPPLQTPPPSWYDDEDD